ncbi:MAG: LptF/LptG family permease [Phycisphaerae bacterium]
MNTIDRYIARSFFNGYLILIAVGMGIRVISDLLVNIDEFTEDTSVPLLTVLFRVADFYFYNMPLYYAQLSGPLIAVTAAFTLAMMMRNNELTVLIAAGVPLQRLIIPVMAVAVTLFTVSMLNRELMIPAAAEKIARSHDDVIGSNRFGVYCVRDNTNAALSALEFNPVTGVMRYVFIVEPTKPGENASIVEADAAAYDAARKVWKLDRGRRVTHPDPGTPDALAGRISIKLIDEFAFQMTPEQLGLRRGGQWADLLSVRQLNQLLLSQNLANRPALNMTRHVRLTEPLAQLVLLLLALPAFLSREPLNVLASGGRTVLVGGAFFLVLFLAQGLTADPEYAALVAWMPILAFGPLAAMQIANIKT